MRTSKSWIIRFKAAIQDYNTFADLSWGRMDVNPNVRVYASVTDYRDNKDTYWALLDPNERVRFWALLQEENREKANGLAKKK